MSLRSPLMAAALWATIAGPAHHNAGPFVTSRGAVQREGGQAVGAERNSRLADGPILSPAAPYKVACQFEFTPLRQPVGDRHHSLTYDSRPTCSAFRFRAILFQKAIAPVRSTMLRQESVAPRRRN